LKEQISTEVEIPALSVTGKLSGIGIAITALVLLAASSSGMDLGLPTLIAAAVTAALVLLLKRQGPGAFVRGISWSVIPLVAGLFVLVQGIESTGVMSALAGALKHAADVSSVATSLGLGAALAMFCNLVNNLPLGLVSGAVVQLAHVPHMVSGAVLLGIDLGPNLSVTGSLATILWLLELRKEGEQVTALEFLKLGFVVMPPALIGSVASLIVCSIALR
jgi:arsenical pump membrane protein